MERMTICTDGACSADHYGIMSPFPLTIDSSFAEHDTANSTVGLLAADFYTSCDVSAVLVAGVPGTGTVVLSQKSVLLWTEM